MPSNINTTHLRLPTGLKMIATLAGALAFLNNSSSNSSSTTATSLNSVTVSALHMKPNGTNLSDGKGKNSLPPSLTETPTNSGDEVNSGDEGGIPQQCDEESTAHQLMYLVNRITMRMRKEPEGKEAYKKFQARLKNTATLEEQHESRIKALEDSKYQQERLRELERLKKLEEEWLAEEKEKQETRGRNAREMRAYLKEADQVLPTQSQAYELKKIQERGKIVRKMRIKSEWQQEWLQERAAAQSKQRRLAARAAKRRRVALQQQAANAAAAKRRRVASQSKHQAWTAVRNTRPQHATQHAMQHAQIHVPPPAPQQRSTQQASSQPTHRSWTVSGNIFSIPKDMSFDEAKRLLKSQPQNMQKYMVNVQNMPMVNAQNTPHTMPMVNAQNMPMVNAQNMPMVNAQTLPMVNHIPSNHVGQYYRDPTTGYPITYVPVQDVQKYAQNNWVAASAHPTLPPHICGNRR